jgi:DNA-binding SARP family transcriptional activator/tetratricopeptide (TPR) repeat protein
VDVRVLGPVEISTDRGPVRLAPLGRRLVAVLAASAGKVVSVDRLTEALWDGRPSADARNRVQVAVSALRRGLSAHQIPEPLVVTANPGYLLNEDVARLDIAEFTSTLRRARTHVAQGEVAAAINAFQSALALWRGVPFEGVDMTSLQVEAARLEELRLTAAEECGAAQLAAGLHTQLVPELTELVANHPFREGLRGMLMLALHRCGRDGEAVAVYRAGHDLALRELGLEPNAQLQKLLRSILDRDPALGPAEQSALPAPQIQPLVCLPPDRATFTGRIDALRWLDKAIEPCTGTPPLVICGPGGVGKTALAVHWAYRLRDHFPDGQLYLNLRGFGHTEPLDPVDAIDMLLQLLGKPPSRPAGDLAAASAALRTCLAGRLTLLLLDNAASAEQVRPLLPGEATCVTLVTSRNRLSGLVAVDGALRHDLAALSPDESLELFTRLLGAHRIAAEPHAAAETLAQCGQLPLAIGIAAANLLDAPDLAIAQYRDALHAGSTLDLLSVPGDVSASMRPVLWHSYERLPFAQRRALRLFGLAALTHLTAASVAAVLELPAPSAEQLLQGLCQASLLDLPQLGRYVGHDLIRLYAGELSLQDDSEDERALGLRRLIAHYTRLAAAADAVLRPRPDAAPAEEVFPDQPSAVDWFDHEYANMTALFVEALGRSWHQAAVALVTTTRGYLRRMYRLTEWEREFGRGLLAAQTIGDLEAIAEMYDGLGDRHFQARQWDRARTAWVAAAAAFRDAGDEYRWALSHDNVGMVELELGNPEAAERYHREALDSPAYAARSHAAASTYIHLGIVYGTMHRWSECEAALDKALSLATDAANHELACFALHNLAELFRQTGDLAAARAKAEAQIDLAGRARLPLRVARGHQFLAELLTQLDRSAAETHRRAALAIYDHLEHPEAATLRTRST